MTNWRDYGSPTSLRWRSIVEQAGGPPELAGSVAWAMAHPHGWLALAMLHVESKYGTAFNRNKAENKNPLNLRPPNGNGYMAYPLWVDGVDAWRERITSPDYKGGIYAQTVSLEDLIHVYAPGDDDNDEAAYAATIRTLFLTWGVTPKETPMATKPTVLLIAGHRSYGDAGNPVEKNMTDDLARAYKTALTAAGYTVTWLQEADGDGDPDDTVGGLDTVSAKAGAWCAKQANGVLLDLHFEGTAPSVRGCFAIIPDVTGLRTGAPVAQNPNDTWNANFLDRDLGGEIVQNLHEMTGLPLRTGIREPGLMDESQTGVGGQGYRLATFAYTSPYRATVVRLVVEHGAHTNAQDRAIITAPGFFAKCGTAAVAALNAVYGVTPTKPLYTKPVGWPSKKGDTGIIQVGEAKARLITCEVECIKPNGTVPRAYASAKAGQSGPKIALGAKRTVIATVTVPAGKRTAQWHVLDNYERVGANGFLPKLPQA
jgi:hypothetical protein